MKWIHPRSPSMWDKIVVGLQELTLVNRKLGGSQKTEPGVAEEKKKKKK